MKRNRRSEREAEPASQRRRWLIACGIAAAALLLWCCWPAAGPAGQRQGTAAAPLEQYELLDRSWAGLVAQPVEDNDAGGDDEADRLRFRAEQWQNLDISITDDR